MFTKKDYLKYFDSIERTEELMLFRAKDLSKHFKDDQEALKLISEWQNDELNHREIVKDIIKRIK